MSRIDDLIKEHCPEGVAFKELDKVCKIKTGEAVSKQLIVSNPGEYPVINSGREPLGFIDQWNTENDPIGITSRGAGVGSITWCEGRYYRGNLNYSCTIIDEAVLSVRFLFYLLNDIQDKIQALCTYDGIPALNKGNLEKLKIPIPPLPVQQAIVDILDAFTKLEAELEAELEARRQQYAYYRNSLLSFNEIGRNVERESCFVQWRSLGEIGVFIRGNGLQKKDFTETGVGCIHYGQIYTHYGVYADKTKTFISDAFAKKLRKAKKGNLVIATTSENDEDVCKAVAWLGDEDIAVSGDAYIYQHSLHPKYVAYFFQTDDFQKQKRQYITGTKVRRVSGDSMSKIKIPVPSLSEQERIVAILDKFDALVNDISSGLPAEIAARRQQYTRIITVALELAKLIKNSKNQLKFLNK